MSDNQISCAVNTIDSIIPLVEEAESLFNSARKWSFFDILGNWRIADFFKYKNLNEAFALMNKIYYLLQKLSDELENTRVFQDFEPQINNFAVFADLFMDSSLADFYVHSKIKKSISYLQNLRENLYELRSRLTK